MTHTPFDEIVPAQATCTRRTCVYYSLSRATDDDVCPTCGRKCLRAVCHRPTGQTSDHTAPDQNNAGTLPRIYGLSQGPPQ